MAKSSLLGLLSSDFPESIILDYEKHKGKAIECKKRASEIWWKFVFSNRNTEFGILTLNISWMVIMTMFMERIEM